MGCTTFKVNLSQRAKDITEHVRSKPKVPKQDQVLQLGSKTLKSQRTLSSYGTDKETTIHLTLKVVKPSDKELPLVLMETGDEGQRHNLQVQRSSSVAQVRQLFQTQRAVTPKKLWLVENGFY